MNQEEPQFKDLGMLAILAVTFALPSVLAQASLGSLIIGSLCAGLGYLLYQVVARTYLVLIVPVLLAALLSIGL